MWSRRLLNVGLGAVLVAGGVIASGVVNLGVSGATTKVHPRLMVSPSGSLKNNQVVKVRGLHFTPKDTLYLVQCLVKAKDASGCNVTAPVPVTVNAKGAFSWTKFTVKTGTVGTGTAVSTCGTKRTDLKNCAISAGNAAGGDSAVARITFIYPPGKNKG